MRKTFIKTAVWLFPLFAALLMGATPHEEENVQTVTSKSQALLLTVNGVINPASSDYLIKGISRARDQDRSLIIIEMDTPGGLDSAMRAIIKEILASPIPVVVYVSPPGSRAASAGAFITLAAHVAVMAPGTNIGAAHPVQMGGAPMDEVMKKKTENDSAAYIVSLAERRGRNAQWAEEAVRDSAAISEGEAVEEKVIDFISENRDDLLKKLHGWKVKTSKGEVVIDTEGMEVVSLEMNMKERILDTLSNPNIAYLLMMLGFYGLFFELSNPGSIFPGIIGSISLILALYSLQAMSMNYAGLMLIILGMILFLLEIKVVSHGALTIGGIIALVMGSMMLVESPAPYLRISLFVIIPSALATGAFFFFLVGMGVRAQRGKVTTGKEGMVGLSGRAESDIGREGRVFVHGEEWEAVSDENIEKGKEIEVVGIAGLKLKVRGKPPLSNK